jgi:hypothetical protein
MNTETKKATPAYTTYTAFTNLINDLRENGMPSHITRSVVNGSNSGKATMIASLRYLGLIDKSHASTDRMTQLVENQEDYSRNLNELLLEKYPFLFDDSIDIKNTTTEKVSEKFKEAGASGSTVSKCMAFFLQAAKAADIEVSSRVTAPKVASTPRMRRTKWPKKASQQRENTQALGHDDDAIPDGMERITVPLRGMEDGILYFPEDMDADDARRAIRMTTFILNQYYGIEDER